MGALLSFLGGGVFRAIWGEAAGFISKWQDSKIEADATRLQAELEAARHAREMERLKVVSDLGIKEIEVRSDAEVEAKDAEAFIAAMATINAKSGVKWVDGWNSSIRPAAATTALLLWWFCLYQNGFQLTDWDKELVSVIIGFYFAHRVYSSKNK